MIMNLEQKGGRDEHTVSVISSNCTGCRLCSLACSFHYTKAFSLSDARIKIMGVGNTYNFMVSFTKECTKCGECVKYCYHNVLHFSKN